LKVIQNQKKDFIINYKPSGSPIRKLGKVTILQADIQYSTIDDSVFFSGRRKLKLEKPVYSGAIEDCFMSMRHDESASFILQAEPFFIQTLQSDLPSFFEADDYFKVKITLIEVQSEEDYFKEKQAFLHWTEDFGDYEKVVLQQFIKEEKIDAQPTESGLIFMPLEKGEGRKIEIGDTIMIHYEGIFLNGKYFDSTKRRKQPFQFVYGTEWQVIDGLEEGLSYLREVIKPCLLSPQI
jgi:FKBP-type peptidyl-prolyl cis-trans isomerase FkpA